MFSSFAKLLFFSALVLCDLPSGYAGPACTKKYYKTAQCVQKCGARWGYPGSMMGRNPWGVVMAPSEGDPKKAMAAAIAEACGTVTCVPIPPCSISFRRNFPAHRRRRKSMKTKKTPRSQEQWAMDPPTMTPRPLWKPPYPLSSPKRRSSPSRPPLSRSRLRPQGARPVWPSLLQRKVTLLPSQRRRHLHGDRRPPQHLLLLRNPRSPKRRNQLLPQLLLKEVISANISRGTTIFAPNTERLHSPGMTTWPGKHKFGPTNACLSTAGDLLDHSEVRTHCPLYSSQLTVIYAENLAAGTGSAYGECKSHKRGGRGEVPYFADCCSKAYLQQLRAGLMR